jgi:acetyl esterase/lipase
MSVVKMKNLIVLFYFFAFFSSWGQNDRKAFVDSLLSGVEVKKDIRYNTGERPLLLDIYYPERNNDKPLPCVVWIHGGGLTDTTIQKDYDLIRWELPEQ